ncbi:MAG TPA: putative glycoside hydrolase [Gemmatimonadaceae bacterium]|nr:putative glycoside hydrolase [Gemmatimonadaceae bacterium]
MMSRVSFLAFALAACGVGAAERPEHTTSSTVTDTTSVAAAPAAVSAAPAPAGGAAAASRSTRDDLLSDSATVRALYVNRWATHSAKKMKKLIAFADSTEINALVLDMKDEFGLNYRSSDPAVRRNAGNAGTIRDVKVMLDTLKAHGILPIARIVVFKDSVAARLNPTETIRKPDGSAWRDREGLIWVNPYSPSIREYNIKVAEELVRLGFEEIQFDYIRFPEPYRSLPPQVFPNANGVSKPQALADFLQQARTRINALGVRSTADIFGLVTTVKGALEIGQEWEKLAPVTDVLLPMVYPSHYPRGSFGVQRPNADPYTIIKTAIARARERNAAIGITAVGHVRPWLQAFTLGQPKYGPEHLTAQKKAVYDAGYRSWVLWSPGSNYDIFVPALERDVRR